MIISRIVKKGEGPTAPAWRHLAYTAGAPSTEQAHTMTLQTMLAALSLVVLAACNSKVDPQLQADQMTLSDATCAQAEIGKIADEAVREKFAARCARRDAGPGAANQ
ncbi:hypothetical protein GCM10011572_15160 [Pseudoduganella buxea]|nr:hypothetical protein GCM10011572_15160 [Pseudoduganella buxea]